MTDKKKTPQKNALGKGLEALLEGSTFFSEKGNSNSVQEIPINQIKVNPFQPRKDFDEKALLELSESIKTHGIIQPLTVRKTGTNRYELISGERRLRASQLANLTHVPGYVRIADDKQMLEMALVENIQRENLNPIEISLSYQRLLTECNIKQDTLAERIGKDRTTVNNYIRLLKLPPDIQIALRDKKISMGHARALINVEEVHTQLTILKDIIEKDLSVRSVEDRVRMLAESKVKETSQATKTDNIFEQATLQLSSKLTGHFGTPVKISTNTQGKGEIKITFADKDDLDRICNLLAHV